MCCWKIEFELRWIISNGMFLDLFHAINYIVNDCSSHVKEGVSRMKTLFLVASLLHLFLPVATSKQSCKMSRIISVGYAGWFRINIGRLGVKGRENTQPCKIKTLVGSFVQCMISNLSPLQSKALFTFEFIGQVLSDLEIPLQALYNVCYISVYK